MHTFQKKYNLIILNRDFIYPRDLKTLELASLACATISSLGPCLDISAEKTEHSCVIREIDLIVGLI